MVYLLSMKLVERVCVWTLVKRKRMTFDGFGGEYISRIDGFINRHFTEKIENAEYPFIADFYRDLLEYLNRDGKRVRPLVMLASYLGYRRFFRNTGAAIGAASALEIMHSMLLIQDDMIDRAPLRRGKRSFHLLMQDRYSSYTRNTSIGNDISLILADVLFSDAVEIISGLSFRGGIKDRFLGAFSRTYQVTAWGQLLDSLHSLSERLDDPGDVAMRISTMKTAYYTIYYPLLMGYALSGKDDPGEKDRIRGFSLPLGIAFQLRDDLQGVFSTDRIIGKSADSDIREGKLTLLVQYAIEAMAAPVKGRFLSLFLKEEKSDTEVGEIRAMLRDSGAGERAAGLRRELVSEASSMLGRLSVSGESRGVLAGLVDLVAGD